jgi:hypothetical protein
MNATKRPTGVRKKRKSRGIVSADMAQCGYFGTKNGFGQAERTWPSATNQNTIKYDPRFRMVFLEFQSQYFA